MTIISQKARSVFFALLGALFLYLKNHYTGPHQSLVLSYWGNLSASFALYFIVRIAVSRWKWNPLMTPLIALLVVEIFEITNGYGIMANVYNSMDLIANFIGICLAALVDSLFVGTNSKNQ